ncbi:hypothetical protein [Clostridium butyricum]|uniref:hypothetical protein n=1 Tax=Clostridium butyricum TaxID=1492 RepID=UPI00374F85F8
MNKTKLDLILSWKYDMTLSPSNPKIQLKEFKNEISLVHEYFNQECMGSANIKQITSCVIDETNNLLMIKLESMNQLPVPIRGIRMFSQKLMAILQEKRGKEFVENMIKRKSIFRMLSVEEVQNLKLKSSNEKKDAQEPIALNNDKNIEEKENNFTILNNDLSGNKELRKKLMTMIKIELNYLEDLDNDNISQINREEIDKAYAELTKGGE